MDGSPIVLPSNVVGLPGSGRESRLLGPGEWKVCWSNEPRRMVVLHRLSPLPSWADDEWVPEGAEGWLTQDVACRAVLEVALKKGWEVDQVDEALGEGVKAWAMNPQRVMHHPGQSKNDLVLSYEAVRAHIVAGGRLRDVPIVTVEIVARYFGLEIWRYWLHKEVQEHGPFEGEYADLVGDLWTNAPATQMERVQ